MHQKNAHNTDYDFDVLIKTEVALTPFVFTNDYGTKTIDFSNPKAVFLLNKALFKATYDVHWSIPEDYLCPPVPGRVDYLHYISDLFNDDENLRGLDIGTGANFAYPLLGAANFNWFMHGCDINETSVHIARQNLDQNPQLSEYLQLSLQEDPGHIFKGIITPDTTYDFTMCNPPFYTDAKAAAKANITKSKNLGTTENTRNFGGQSNELWCNGGEALFIKRMIRESALFKEQVRWFTTLVSRKQNLPKIYKQLDKLKATHKTIIMEQGNKQSRFVAWSFKL